MAVGREQSSFIAHAPEPSSDTMTRGTPFEITLTGWVSNTAVDGTELTSASLSAYIGNWLEFLDGNIAGEWARIRTFDGTLTVGIDPPSAAAPTATRARMWVPPEPLVPSTTVSVGTTDIISASRVEADDYWNDPDRLYVVAEGGGGVGAIARGDGPRLIQDFVAATDTFTVAALPSGPTVGDLFVIRQPLKPRETELPDIPVAIQTIQRKFVKGTWDRDPGVTGIRGGQALSVSLDAIGASAASSGATGAIPALEAHDLLQSILYNGTGSAISVGYGDGASTVAAGSTTTSINITTGTQERFAVGNVVLIVGEVAYITAITDGGAGVDVLTVAPALTAAPPAGATVSGGVNYRPRRAATAAFAGVVRATAAGVLNPDAAGGFRSHTLEAYLNGTRLLAYGWHFDLEIAGLTQQDIPMWKFTGPCDTVLVTTLANLYVPSYATALPRPTKGSRLVLGGTTYSTIKELSLKIGYDIQPVTNVGGTPHGRNGHMVVNRVTSGSMKIWMEDASHWNTWERAGEQSLVFQSGSTTAGTVGFAAPAIQYTSVTRGREGGGWDVTCAFDVLRSNLTNVDDFVVFEV